MMRQTIILKKNHDILLECLSKRVMGYVVLLGCRRAGLCEDFGSM